MEYAYKGPSWDTGFTTYQMNTALGYRKTYTIIRLKPKRYLRYPSDALVYIDGNGGHLNADWRVDSSYYHFAYARHPGKTCNMVMGDGRVQELLWWKYVKKATTDEKFLFCRNIRDYVR